ncbi:MAG: 50S ribosomal protein L10 [Brevinematia bacterium]
MSVKEKKKELFSEINTYFENNYGVIMADFKGLSVAELDEIRRKAESEGGIPKVVKNNVFEKVLESKKIEGFENVLKNNTIAFFSRDDLIKVLKLLVKYSKENDKFLIKGVYFDGKLFEQNDVVELSKLPSKQEILSMIVGNLQGVISSFVGTLNSVVTTFVGTIKALEEKNSKN